MVTYLDHRLLNTRLEKLKLGRIIGANFTDLNKNILLSEKVPHIDGKII